MLVESPAPLGEGVELASGLGVLNAPVEAFWRRSKRACSSGGRSGGAGWVGKGLVLETRVFREVFKRRRRVLPVVRRLRGREGGILVFSGEVAERDDLSIEGD